MDRTLLFPPQLKLSFHAMNTFLWDKVVFTSGLKFLLKDQMYYSLPRMPAHLFFCTFSERFR